MKMLMIASRFLVFIILVASTHAFAQTERCEVSPQQARALEEVLERAKKLSSVPGKQVAAAFEQLKIAGTDAQARAAATTKLESAWGKISSTDRERIGLKSFNFGKSTASFTITKKNGTCCGCLFSDCCGPKSCSCSWGSCKAQVQSSDRVLNGGF